MKFSLFELVEGKNDGYWTNNNSALYCQWFSPVQKTTDIGNVLGMLPVKRPVLYQRIQAFMAEINVATVEMLKDEDEVIEKLQPIMDKYGDTASEWKVFYDTQVEAIRMPRKQRELAAKQATINARRDLESIVKRLDDAVAAKKSPGFTKAIIEDLKANLNIHG